MHGDIWPKINSQIELIGNQMKAFDDDLAKIDHISKKSVYLFQADETFLT